MLKKRTDTEEILKITELNREYYRSKIDTAESNHDLTIIRDEFCNTDLTHDNTR